MISSSSAFLRFVSSPHVLTHIAPDMSAQTSRIAQTMIISVVVMFPPSLIASHIGSDHDLSGLGLMMVSHPLFHRADASAMRLVCKSVRIDRRNRVRSHNIVHRLHLTVFVTLCVLWLPAAVFPLPSAGSISEPLRVRLRILDEAPLQRSEVHCPFGH